MNKKATIIVLLLIPGILSPLFSQTTARERIEQKRKQEAQRTSSSVLRGSRHHTTEEEIITNARWSRIIYRYIDLSKAANEPLKQSIVSGFENSNFFTHIFRLLQDEKIRVYEYLDGQEDFTEDNQVSFPDFLKRFDIYHTITDDVPEVDDADIPSEEVVGYYLKEIYYVDDASSGLRIRPMALCPILLIQDEYVSGTTRYPLFWAPYSELSPYARQIPIMGNSFNNSINQSVDDFFRKRSYEGEIYKTGGPGSRAIPQYTSSPEEIKAEQQRIEQELRNFEQLIRGSATPVTPPKQQQRRKSTQMPPSKTPPSGSPTMRNRRY